MPAAGVDGAGASGPSRKMDTDISHQTWIALLRGVNVGGTNKVPMADLRDLCAKLGWRDVRSYIASGNLVFGASGPAETLAQTVSGILARHMGVETPVVVLSATDLRAALDSCPFAPQEGRHLHGFMAMGPLSVDLGTCEALRGPTEALALRGRVIWLHTPDGIGKSKLAERLPRLIGGVPATARNLNTLRKLAEMAGV